MTVVVGLYKFDTQSCQNLTADQRVDFVRQAVEITREHTAVYKGGLGGDQLHGIFLAPEYCFARSTDDGAGDHSFGTQRQMEEDHVKQKLRPVFGQLSTGFKNGLIVPGTVAWRKSLLPAQGSKNRTPEEVEQARRKKYSKRLKDSVNVNLYYPGPDDDSNDYSFTEKTSTFPEPFMRRDDRRDWLETPGFKRTVLKTTARYIAKNTAHCYYNSAEPIYKYNKIGDFYEVFQPVDYDDVDTVMVPNRGSEVTGTSVGPGRFQAAGLDFGIAVCYDQSLSVQDRDVRSFEPLQKTAGPVDFHLLLSAHIPPSLDSANLKNGGYLLSCSSKDNCNKVLRKDGKEQERHKSVEVGPARLDLFILMGKFGG